MNVAKFNVHGQELNVEDSSARQTIGNLTELETTNRNNLVEAINEVKNTIGSETLQTTSQTVKGAINEVKQSIAESGGGMSASYNSSTNTLTIA